MAQDPLAFPSFDLADGTVPSLDLPLPPGMSPSAPPAVPTTATAAKQNPLAQLGPMLPLIAAAMKQGGRAGLAGFLQGVQQARARKQQEGQLAQQNARVAAQDQRAAEQQNWQRGVQEQQLAAAEQQRRQQLLQQFQAAIGGVDDPEAVRALLELYGPQADALKIGRPVLEGYANRVATPTALQKRAAERIIADLEKQHGDKWLQIGPSFTYRVPGEAQPVPFEELLRRAGRATTGPLPNLDTAAAPNTPEEQFYQTFAREHGSQSFSALSGALQRQARKEWMQADDRPSQQGEALVTVTETDPVTGEQVTSLVPRRAGEVSRRPAAPPNQAQFTAAGYAGRIEQSETTLTPLESTIAQMNPASFEVQQFINRPWAQSGAMQSYLQAARNFINAVLRRESGAVISPAEFAEARQQYLPLPGDNPETLAQKRANRAYVLETMRRAAGRAYEPPVTPPGGGRGAGPAGSGAPVNPFRR